jgi:hypothetical protein
LTPWPRLLDQTPFFGGAGDAANLLGALDGLLLELGGCARSLRSDRVLEKTVALT